MNRTQALRAPLWTLILLLGWTLVATPQARPVQGRDEGPGSARAVPLETPSEERLLELAEEARRAVVAHYGETEEDLTTPVEIVDRETLVETLLIDLRPQMVIQFGEDQADEITRSSAQIVAELLLARYAFDAGKVLICRDNIEALSGRIEMPRLREEGPLRALMVHEFVHARDGREVDFGRLFGSCANTDEIMALNAVVEGHAQHVARAIAAGPGRESDFQYFTDSITVVPSSLTDPAQRLLAEISASTFAFAYRDGERFVAAIAEARGEQALAGLFSSPPKDSAEVLRPLYYLDPESRPEVEVAFDPALDHFDAVAVPDEFRRQRMGLMRPQLEAVFAGVDPLLTKDALDALIDSRVHFCQDPEDPSRALSATLYGFETPGKAQTFLSVQQALLRMRDEQFSSGSIRITDAAYTDLSRPEGARGVLSEKVVETLLGEEEALTVLLVRESTLVELSAVEDEDDPATLVRWADEVLEVALGLREPAERAVEEEPGDQDESETE